MLCRGSVHFCERLLVLLILIQTAEGKRCLNRESIGNRENNFHDCNHPVYSECCEHGNRFTCCEPLFTKNLREQLQLWGMLALMVMVGAMLYSCLVKDKDLIRSDTLKQAVESVGRKLGIRQEKEKDNDNGQEITQPCTSHRESRFMNLAVPDQRPASSSSTTTTLPRHFYHDV